MESDIRIVRLEPTFTPLKFRTPLKFGSGQIREITSLTVEAEVETRRGVRAIGWGQILLSDLWAWPGKILTHDQRDEAMRVLSRRACGLLGGGGVDDFGHPIDLYMAAKGELMALGGSVASDLQLAEPVNALTVLMCAAPADAAIHDAFGRANGVSSYAAYGKEFCRYDLSRYLGPKFRGRYVADFLRKTFQPEMPVFHLVGGADKLTDGEISPDDPRDGLPVSLAQWIARDGVFCLKIKLRGNDLDWDVRRTASVAAVASEALEKLGCRRLCLSQDSNEMCDGPQYVIEYLHKLRQASPAAYDALAYVEQPTARDLEKDAFDMHELNGLKPVIVDESVYDLAQIDRAFELGWGGLALKTCKGQTNCLLYIAAAAAAERFYTVQDLTNPGLALVHSASLAASASPLVGFEYNARQFLPAADAAVQEANAEIFSVRRGLVATGTLDSVGLGYRR